VARRCFRPHASFRIYFPVAASCGVMVLKLLMTSANFDVRDSDEFRSSPLSVLYSTEKEVRRRLSDSAAIDNSPFLADMRQEGRDRLHRVSAALYRRLDPFGDLGHETAWRLYGRSHRELEEGGAAAGPGHRDHELAPHRFEPARHYVGNRAGERILGGQIRRGTHDTMQAAIWLSDLRGFTALSDRLPAETVVDILNHYFDCQVSSIGTHGGEVLKFMGDGLLAVFSDRRICRRCPEGLLERTGGRTRIPRQGGRNAIPDWPTVIERFRFGVALCMWGESVRQYRRRQPARLHLYRPRHQSCGAAGKNRRSA